MFARHFEATIPWAHYRGVYTDRFPASRRKSEWQAQETKSSVGHGDCTCARRATGPRSPPTCPLSWRSPRRRSSDRRERRLSPRETARLQGLPDTFVFPDQPAAATYTQMGNGVNVGAVWHVFREHVKRDRRSAGGQPRGAGDSGRRGGRAAAAERGPRQARSRAFLAVSADRCGPHR